MFVLLPIGYGIANLFSSEIVAIFCCGGSLLIMLVGSILGIVLGAYARRSGAWAIVGIVTGILAFLFALFLCVGSSC